MASNLIAYQTTPPIAKTTATMEPYKIANVIAPCKGVPPIPTSQ